MFRMFTISETIQPKLLSNNKNKNNNNMGDFLYLIDLQKDFISGSLAALGASEETYIKSICTEIKKEKDSPTKYSKIYVTHDWHPPHHCSFNAFPPHCVQDTNGADIPDEILKKLQEVDGSYKKRVSNPDINVVNLYKGFDQTCDTYAAARTPAVGRPQSYAPDNEKLALENYVRFYESLNDTEKQMLQTKTSENTAFEHININGKSLPPLMLKPYKIATCEEGTEANTGSALKTTVEQKLTKFGEDGVTQFKIEEQSPKSITILGLCTDFCAANTALNMMANFRDKYVDDNAKIPTIIFRSDLSRPIGFANIMTDDKNTRPNFYGLDGVSSNMTNNDIRCHSCNARMIVYYMMMYLMGITVTNNCNSESVNCNFTFDKFDNLRLKFTHCYLVYKVNNDNKFSDRTYNFSSDKNFSIDVTKKQFYCLERNDGKLYSLLDIFDHEGGFELKKEHIADETEHLWNHLNSLNTTHGGGKRKNIKMNNKKHNHSHKHTTPRPPSNFFLLPGSKTRQKHTTKSKTASKKPSSGLGDYEKMGVSTFMHKSKKRTQMLYKKNKNGKTYFRMKDDKNGAMKYVLLK